MSRNKARAVDAIASIVSDVTEAEAIYNLLADKGLLQGKSAVLAAIEKADGDALMVGRGLFMGFIEHMAVVERTAYHDGMRDGVTLNLAARRVAERETLLNMSIEDLEFSVRTGNCLRAAEVSTIAELLLLQRHTVLGWKNAGARTWREIADMQSYIRGDKRDG